jgi:ribonuclease BN (tRNA processing enzyme)
VQVIVVPASVAPARGGRYQYLTSFLLNRAVAIDAGSLGLYRSPQAQAHVQHVFLTHSHIDHVASLPIFLDNVYQGTGECVTVYGNAAVLDCLRRDLFNDRIWPDLLRLSTQRPPYLRLQELHPGQPVEVAGLRVTPVAVNHAVPTCGFVVEDGAATVVFPSDTGPTEAIWEQANRTANVRAVFLEVTFPNAMAWLADLAKHLTPEMFAREAAKLEQPARFVAVHISARFRPQVVAELRALGLPNLELARFGKPYLF